MKSSKYLKKQSNKAAELSFKKGELDKTAASKFIKAFKSLPLNESIPALNFYLTAVKRELSKSILTVTSASKLSYQQISELKKTFAKDFKILETHEEIAPSILGGVRVRIGDVVFDGSIRERLNQLKEAIST